MKERPVGSVGTAVLWLAAIALLLAFPGHVPARPQAELQGPAFEAEWLKSGDPCLPLKRRKEWMKATYGVDVSYLKCYPLRVQLTWDIEETYRHHSDLGTDRFSFNCQELFPAHLQVDYDQKKRTEVESFLIEGPAPCCPGDVALAVPRADASFLTYKEKFSGQSFQMFKSSDPINFQVKPPEQVFFVYSWHRPGSLGFEPARVSISAPKIRLSDGVVPKPWKPGGGIHQYATYGIHLTDLHSISWDQIRPFVEGQKPFEVEYPIDVREEHDSAAPLTETHTVKGKLTVRISFGEEEHETWQVTVTGKERDSVPGLIQHKTIKKNVTKDVNVQAEFDWLLEGTFLVKKVKKVQTYESGIINGYSQTPSLVVDPPGLYKCDLLPCGGSETDKETGKFVKTLLFGKISGSTVQLTWPFHPADACVSCIALKDKSYNSVYRHQFTTKEFIDAVNRERLPLKDGAVVNGSEGDWLAYSIALKKIK